MSPSCRRASWILRFLHRSRVPGRRRVPRAPRVPRVPGHLGVVAALVLGLAAAPACKERADSNAPDPAALRAQQALIARRDALLATRKQTQAERQRLQEELRRAAQAGADTTELQRKLDELDSQLEVQNDQLADEFQALSTKLDSIAVATDKSALMAARESDLGSRERNLAQREERMAQREAKVAEREREAARAREACAVAPTMIVQAPTKGSSYSRKEIESQLSRARSAMAKRGILAADLPSYAQGLEREATRAMSDSDTGKAFLAASQLAATVEAVKIDKEFVKAKIARLQRQISGKGSKLDDATNKSMGAGIAEVMQKWGDGDFARANAKLNQLDAALK